MNDFFPHSDKMKEAIQKHRKREEKQAKKEQDDLIAEAIEDELIRWERG